jgi:transcriptional regulator with XRE-family HTH domain
MELAKILDNERARLGLTSNALAVKAGMSAGQLQRILTGETKNPGLLTVVEILKALDRPLSWLEYHMKRGERT